MKVKKTETHSDTPPLMVQYRYIMQNFDFDRVQEFMEWRYSYRNYNDEGDCIGKSEWKMCLADKEYRVPTTRELKEIASSLLVDLMESQKHCKSAMISMATGPFKAIYRYGILELDCIIESWSDD